MTLKGKCLFYEMEVDPFKPAACFKDNLNVLSLQCPNLGMKRTTPCKDCVWCHVSYVVGT
jgi:hypothetical protein